MSQTPIATAPIGTVDLAVGGMTCASCVARVEKKLGKLDGVTASVNLATESAHIVLTREVSDDELIATVARAGYTAAVTGRTTARPDADARQQAGPGEAAGIQQSGYLTLGLADPARDTELLLLARTEALKEAANTPCPGCTPR